MTARSLFAASTLLIAAALGLAACSPTTTIDGSAPEPAQTFANMDDWFAAWNDCLRDHGVTVNADGSWEAKGQEEAAAMDAATKECNASLPAAPTEATVSTADPENYQKTVECLREKGYEVPDYKEGDSGLAVGPDVSTDDLKECMEGAAESATK